MPILKELKQHKILLDTHVWLWAMSGSSRLTRSFQVDFERILHKQGVMISVMSIWEMGMLVSKERVEIDRDIEEWIEQALDHPGMTLCEISPKIAIESTRLPGVVHGDPVDRLLIASAHVKRAVLVTCDQKILEYAAGSFISAFNPC